VEANPIRYIGLTPIGTIQRVPTGVHRNTPPVVFLPTYQRKTDEDTSIAQYIETLPHFDDTREAKSASAGMRSIKDFHATQRNKFIECPKLTGLVSQEKWEEVLQIYENNQVYYQECFQQREMKREQANQKFTLLEQWFMLIIEPLPSTGSKEDYEAWKNRELNKLKTGHSEYCDSEIYPFLGPLDINVKKFLQEEYAKLM